MQQIYAPWGVRVGDDQQGIIPPGAAVKGGVFVLNDPSAALINGLYAYKHLAVWTAPCRCLVRDVGLWLVAETGASAPPEVAAGYGETAGDLIPAVTLTGVLSVDDVGWLPTPGLARMVQAGEKLNVQITNVATASVYQLRPIVTGIAMPS